VQQCGSFTFKYQALITMLDINQNISQIFISVLFLDMKLWKNLELSLSEHCE
jgi:hypothetical protein